MIGDMTITLQPLVDDIARAGNPKRGTSSVKMSLSILDLLPVLSGTADEQISWFQQKGLLCRSRNCPSCGLAMRIQTRNDIQDKRRYLYSVQNPCNLDTHYAKA